MNMSDGVTPPTNNSDSNDSGLLKLGTSIWNRHSRMLRRHRFVSKPHRMGRRFLPVLETIQRRWRKPAGSTNGGGDLAGWTFAGRPTTVQRVNWEGGGHPVNVQTRRGTYEVAHRQPAAQAGSSKPDGYGQANLTTRARWNDSDFTPMQAVIQRRWAGVSVPGGDARSRPNMDYRRSSYTRRSPDGAGAQAKRIPGAKFGPTVDQRFPVLRAVLRRIPQRPGFGSVRRLPQRGALANSVSTNADPGRSSSNTYSMRAGSSSTAGLNFTNRTDIPGPNQGRRRTQPGVVQRRHHHSSQQGPRSQLGGIPFHEEIASREDKPNPEMPIMRKPGSGGESVRESTRGVFISPGGGKANPEMPVVGSSASEGGGVRESAQPVFNVRGAIPPHRPRDGMAEMPFVRSDSATANGSTLIQRSLQTDGPTSVGSMPNVPAAASTVSGSGNRPDMQSKTDSEPPIDVEALVDIVLRRIKRHFEIDQERKGIQRWR